MSFLWKNNTNHTIQLRPSPKQRISLKRISLPPLKNKKKLDGSMTIEAAILLPMLLFFFFSIMSSIEMMRLHGNLELALWETGRRLAIYGVAYEDVKNGSQISLEGLTGLAFSHLYVKNEILDYSGVDYLNKSPLANGTKSLRFMGSTFMEEEDCISLVVTYEVEPLFSFLGIKPFTMGNRYYGHAWTGYTIIEEDEENTDFVFITQNGTVYHETKECTYLKLSIKSVLLSEVTKLQNESGIYYILCVLCKKTEKGERVYVTKWGERYHYSMNCSALKRIITAVKRKDASFYRPCSRCGIL